ncbi:hypothetical protein ACIHDR_28890 [Nocardia sp. NPDC052278]|uniref:hypothetical protein n=1 Tax=unclassified Nocardia TaxID=2637762 RepID=UPI0036B27C7B
MTYVVAVPFPGVLTDVWSVHFVPAEVPDPKCLAVVSADVGDLGGVWAEDVPAGTPFLISPRFEYDLALNEFFQSPGMLEAAYNPRRPTVLQPHQDGSRTICVRPARHFSSNLSRFPRTLAHSRHINDQHTR